MGVLVTQRRTATISQLWKLGNSTIHQHRKKFPRYVCEKLGANLLISRKEFKPHHKFWIFAKSVEKNFWFWSYTTKIFFLTKYYTISRFLGIVMHMKIAVRQRKLYQSKKLLHNFEAHVKVVDKNFL